MESMAKRFELTKSFLSELKEAIRKKDEEETIRIIETLHAADIAEIYYKLSKEEAQFLYLLLDQDTAADALAELDEDEREEFLEFMPSDIIARKFINNMDTDDAADVIGDLSEEKQQEVLRHIEDVEHSGDILDLLAYDEDTAGGLMAKEMVVVNENWTILTCLKELGRQADEVDEVYYVYVVDNDEKFKGIVSLKKMVTTNKATRVMNICETDVIPVSTSTSAVEVAQIMEKYDLVALPVVDSIGRLLGRITIDDIVDVIREEAERDYQLASGISEDVEYTDSLFIRSRARLPWLIIGLVGGVLGSMVLTGFQNNLLKYPEMVIFIPMIAAMGGNVGIQSSAIIVQGLANNTIKHGQTFNKLAKEFSLAALNGIILGGLIFLYNYIFSDSFALTLSVSMALMSVIIFASLFGTILPLLLDKIKDRSGFGDGSVHNYHK